MNGKGVDYVEWNLHLTLINISELFTLKLQYLLTYKVDNYMNFVVNF